MRHLNYHHLEYFRAVAREGHLTRAAQRLHVSQSALSTQIRQLEEALGHELFEREGRSLRLTETGHLALGYAESISALGTELLAVLDEREDARRQRLRVGSVATLSRNFQENFLRPLLDERGVHLVLESAELPQLLERLSVHKLDLVLANRAVGADAERPWRCRRIARQPVCLVGRPRNERRTFRFPADLQGQPLLLPGPSSEIRTGFDLVCEEHGIEPVVLAEVDDMAMLRLLARDSGVAGLMPTVVVQDELRSGQLEQYCVVPNVHEDFYAITMRRRFQPALLKKLLGEDGGLVEVA